MNIKKATSFAFLIVMAANAYAGRLPEFSWDTVPVYIHFGKSAGPLSDEELKFVAETARFVCLEKGHAQKHFGSTEKGIAHDARRLKALNPEIKILFYWNTFLNYPLYDACATVGQNPEWLFRDKEGNPIYKTNTLEQYNLLNPEFRKWWASVAGNSVKKYGCDGIFMDAVNQAKRPLWMRTGWGEGSEHKLTAAAIDMMKRAKIEMGSQSLLLYNGIRSSHDGTRNEGEEYLDYADGVMCEHFTAFHSRDKASISGDIQAISNAGKKGKIVVVQGWPDPEFTWLNKEKMKQPFARLAQDARDKITFSLACFLVAAQENAYFQYSWGYREDHGALIDYPEFRKPLGEPKGEAVKEDWVYTRSFEHATVRVDIEHREASINWKQLDK